MSWLFRRRWWRNTRRQMLGWRTVCAVERDAYCAAILAQRQNDGFLEPFPVWSDVESFDGRPWRGIVDVVSGGFPCQPFSTASRGGVQPLTCGPRCAESLAMRTGVGLCRNVQRKPIDDAGADLEAMGSGPSDAS